MAKNFHRWSGWPGATCLQCGQEDQMEYCVNEHDVALQCSEGHMLCTEHGPAEPCTVHVNGDCLAEPDSV